MISKINTLHFIFFKNWLSRQNIKESEVDIQQSFFCPYIISNFYSFKKSQITKISNLNFIIQFFIPLSYY